MPLSAVFSGRVLVLYTDGLTTTGAVFGKRGGDPEELGRVVSQAAVPSVALAEIVNQLRAGKIAVPKRVFLATDRAVMVRVDLPVPPDRPRPYAQMRELARWEAEMGFPDLPDWEIPAILRATQAVDDAADARIRATLDQRSDLDTGAPVPLYQDVALSLGEIDRATREAAVATRERLSQPVGESGCGWMPVHPDAGLDSAQHPWLLTAIGEFDRAAWAEACKEAKLTLDGILPSWGLTDFSTRKDMPSADGSSGQRLILERHAGAVALVHLAGDAVEALRLVTLNRPDTDEVDLLGRMLDGRQQTQVAAVGFDKPARDEISRAFSQAVHIDDTVTAILTGAAARGLGLKGGTGWPPQIAAAEPRPPIWKSSNFYRAAMVALVVLGILSVDLTTRWQRDRHQAKLDELDAKYEQRRALANNITQAVSKISGLELKIEQTETEIQNLRQRSEVSSYLLFRRKEVVHGVLDAVRSSIPDGVVMREIVESRNAPEVFTLSSWALSDVQAERFISALNENLATLGLVVADETVFRQPGPAGMIGYAARLRIAPLHYSTDSSDTGGTQ